MRKLLLVAATTGYEACGLAESARAMGVEVVVASDRCHQLDDPWRDGAVAVRFDQPQEAIAAARVAGPFDGIVACGDRAAVLAAELAAVFGLSFHSPAAAVLCHDKYAFKAALRKDKLPTPWFQRYPLTAEPETVAAEAPYPCVVKPVSLTGSRGVMRANTATELVAALQRLRHLIESADVRQQGSPEWMLVEEYIPGAEFALEGWMSAGGLQTLAIFDKPDPLEGPYFAETLYVTPTRLLVPARAQLRAAVSAAAHAAGLGPGPIHAEARMAGGRAIVLEIAARAIGGLCARALWFLPHASLHELLVRGALGEDLGDWQREPGAAGVYMIPVPEAGILEEVGGVEAARAVAGIEAVEITAKPGEPLTPLPEGASYLGFIFARARRNGEVEQALRRAQGLLRVSIRPQLPQLRPG